MSTVSLNLLALSVFIISMASLLGPMIHLPAIVPALTTFTLLGLVTADTFAWKGQGMTLFVDWFAQRSPQHRDRIAHHEAGHFLVATLLEIPISGYALSAWDAFRQDQQSQGGVEFDDAILRGQLERGVITQQMVDRYCQVWMAGGAAEVLAYGTVEGVQEDVQKVRTLLAQIDLPQTQWEQKERWAVFQAKQLIQTHQASYDCLVELLQQGKSVAECQAQIRTPRTP
jgi:hypothetical protein